MKAMIVLAVVIVIAVFSPALSLAGGYDAGSREGYNEAAEPRYGRQATMEDAGVEPAPAPGEAAEFSAMEGAPAVPCIEALE